jgi:hypothetical protein
MTDIRFTGFRRGLPLAPEPDVFDLIAGDDTGLRVATDGTPNLTAIAKAAGVNRQRLSEARSALKDGNGGAPRLSIDTLGALVRCYAVIHDVDDKTAAGIILRVSDGSEQAVERAA